MPKSNIKHTVDVIFKPEEVIELLKEKASYLSSVNGMVFDTVTVNFDDSDHKLLKGLPGIIKYVPGFTIHYKAEGS